MKAPRISLATVGFVILVLAINFALIRVALLSWEQGVWETFAFLLMPMIDVLLIACYRLLREERRTAGNLGFAIAGMVATCFVFTLCLYAPNSAFGMLVAFAIPLAMGTINAGARLFGNAVMQSSAMRFTCGVGLEFLLPFAFFSLPPFIVAFLGGRLARYFGKCQTIVIQGLAESTLVEESAKSNSLTSSTGGWHRWLRLGATGSYSTSALRFNRTLAEYDPVAPRSDYQ